MSSYLKISNGSETKAYQLLSDDTGLEKPYVKVSGSILPLTTRTTNGIGLKVKVPSTTTTTTCYTTNTTSDNIIDTSIISTTETWYSIKLSGYYSYSGTGSMKVGNDDWHYLTYTNRTSKVTYYSYANLTSSSQSNNVNYKFYGDPLLYTYAAYTTASSTTYNTYYGGSSNIKYDSSYKSTSLGSTTALVMDYSTTYSDWYSWTTYKGETYTSTRIFYSGKSIITTKPEITTPDMTLLYRPLEVGSADTTVFSKVTYYTTNSAMNSTNSFTSNVSIYSQFMKHRTVETSTYKSYSRRSGTTLNVSITDKIVNIASTSSTIYSNNTTYNVLYGNYLFNFRTIHKDSRTSDFQYGFSGSTSSNDYYTYSYRKLDVHVSSYSTNTIMSWNGDTEYRYSTISDGVFYTSKTTLYSGYSSVKTTTSLY